MKRFLIALTAVLFAMLPASAQSAKNSSADNIIGKYESVQGTDAYKVEVTKNADGSGSVYLTGFKLESVLVSAEQQIDNSKVVPLVNGDSITLTNLCKAGTLSLTASRTAAGLAGGDAISVCDFVRSQGDDGGTLEISWRMNGKDHKMIFSGVCVQRCPPLNMAGNDVPDYPISFTYSNYSDSDSPSWNEAIGSMTTR